MEEAIKEEGARSSGKGGGDKGHGGNKSPTLELELKYMFGFCNVTELINMHAKFRATRFRC